MREHTDLPEDMIYDLVMMKLQAVGLRGVADLLPAELSGGMARRVALARAVALDPMLIMYDEPFAGLDPISLSVIGELIRSLNSALGASSIIVTHDVQESLKIVDYIYFVSGGRVVAEGTVDEIRKYLNADSLHYLSQEGMVKATGRPKESFCMACYDGKYPVPYDPLLDKHIIERRRRTTQTLGEAVESEGKQIKLLQV